MEEYDSVWTTADTLLWLVYVSIWSGEGEQGIEGLEQILGLLDHCNKLAGLVILEMWIHTAFLKTGIWMEKRYLLAGYCLLRKRSSVNSSSVLGTNNIPSMAGQEGLPPSRWESFSWSWHVLVHQNKTRELWSLFLLCCCSVLRGVWKMMETNKWDVVIPFSTTFGFSSTPFKYTRSYTAKRCKSRAFQCAWIKLHGLCHQASDTLYSWKRPLFGSDFGIGFKYLTSCDLWHHVGALLN